VGEDSTVGEGSMVGMVAARFSSEFPTTMITSPVAGGAGGTGIGYVHRIIIDIEMRSDDLK